MNWFKSFWNRLTVPSDAKRLNSFTPRAQEVLRLARKEAERLNHNFVGTEHILLGIIRLGNGPAITVLKKMGLELETLRLEVEKQVGKGQGEKLSNPIPYTPRVKKVLLQAVMEAKALNHSYVGTEHILLGLLLEGDGIAARLFKSLDVNADETRLEIMRELDPNVSPTGNDTELSKTQKSMNLSKQQQNAIDANKRYDVYCTEQNQEVVYRNALFKSRRKLLSTREHDFAGEFMELEQSNGQTVFLNMHSLRKFCEHGTEIVREIIPSK